MSNIEVKITIPNRNIEVIVEEEQFDIEVELPVRDIEVIKES